MKVSVTLSLDVDAAAWALAYGDGDKLRDDVRRYVLGLVQNSTASQEGAVTFVRLGMASGARNVPTS